MPGASQGFNFILPSHFLQQFHPDFADADELLDEMELSTRAGKGFRLGLSGEPFTVGINPWLILPVFAVIVTVLAYNFLGDGLRDAADPYR